MAPQSRFDSRALLDNRQVRIFLSSTFSDMQEERTALIKIRQNATPDDDPRQTAPQEGIDYIKSQL